MSHLSFYDETLLAHAQLSRAGWAVLDAWDTYPGLSVPFLQALDLLRDAQYQTPVCCVHSSTRPSGNCASGDWCTGHCAHTTKGSDDGHRP